ncbi:AAA family ATPase [Hydrogenimonas cancrithermarum]|uniref:ATPase n=1 Tax=Hydrogenimonas cancrithermarum TaxID=2993563 RepID=A0ABM8FLM6_9BACT|nr:MoxR family ATPase [Hydrogenimonas cancrithermarum]BDY13267.1 ATPase [Hydrogenimonas cancrithermarum]
MRPVEVKAAVSHLVDEKVPLFLWGPPGIGKSSIVRQIADEKGIGFIDLRLSLLDPTDLRGIPFFDQVSRQAVWAPPAFLPDGSEAEGVLFLDELNTAAPMVQASAYQLILDRRIGEYRLPDGWAIVAAGNRESDRGVVYRMPAPLANRFVHLEMEIDAAQWRRWALDNGIDASIVGFIGARPDALFMFDAKSAHRSFATPRSWEYVDRILKSTPEAELLMPLIAGSIGEELAAEFLSWRATASDLPDLDAVLQGCEAGVPEDPNTLHVLASMMMQRIDRETPRETLEHLLAYLVKLPGEFSVMIVKELQHKGVLLEKASNWKIWIKNFSYLLA